MVYRYRRLAMLPGIGESGALGMDLEPGEGAGDRVTSPPETVRVYQLQGASPASTLAVLSKVIRSHITVHRDNRFKRGLCV